MIDKHKFYLGSGTVQPYIGRATPFLHHGFGMAQYDRDKPVVTESVRRQVQPILDLMNAGDMTQEDGLAAIDNIFW